jgi:bacteriorhodopsin
MNFSYYIPFIYFTIGIIAFYIALKLFIMNLRKVAQKELERD